MTLAEAAAAILALALFIFFYVKYKSKDLPPGPWGLPIVGYLPWLDPKNPHVTLAQLAEKYGPIYSLQMGSIFTVVLSDVRLVRQAFAQEAFTGRAPLYLTHGVMNGNGIICVQGEKWKDQRKFAITCLKNFGMVKFGPKREKMEFDIKTGVREMIKKIHETTSPINTEPLLMHNLGNVVFNLVFGKTWEENDATWKKLQHYQEEGTKMIGVAGPINFLPFLRFIPKFKKTIDFIRNGICDTHELYQQILKEFKSKEKGEGKEEENNKESEHFMGAFNREMEKRKDDPGFYTTPQFNYLMADLWGAGADTTITTLRWFYLYMARYPKIQERLQREMDDVVGDRELSLDDFPSLHYFQACIAEIQRLRSVTPLGIPHGTLEDTTLDGYKIPKETMVVPLQWAIHMNPKNFFEPEEYNPSRFLENDSVFTKPEAFIPFQTGKRICLGEEYARMLLFLFGGEVLRNFKLCLEDDAEADLEGEVGITLTPKFHKIKFCSKI